MSRHKINFKLNLYILCLNFKHHLVKGIIYPLYTFYEKTSYKNVL